MIEEKVSDEELDSLIKWCHNIAYGRFSENNKVINTSWHNKLKALLELKERRSFVPPELYQASIVAKRLLGKDE